MSSSIPFFFYGTLMNSTILNRVVRTPGLQRQSQKALLKDHRRHRVSGADYPAVLPAAGASVSGILIYGLTSKDAEYIDIFEGSEYACSKVSVQVEDKTVDAQTYLWNGTKDQLEDKEWEYDDFVKDKLDYWIGEEGIEEYAEVDIHAARWKSSPSSTNGKVQAVAPSKDSSSTQNLLFEEFGREFGKNHFLIEETWTNLNHGSYGSAPKEVLDAFHKLQYQAEASPDRFMRREYPPLLNNCRAQVAKFVNCDTADVVLVHNATTGVNIALRSVQYQPEDAILYISTTVYDACCNTILYTVDSQPEKNLHLVPVQVQYPISDTVLVQKIEAAIIEYEAKNPKSKVRVGLIDHISSNPGVIVPIKQIIQVFKKHNVISVIDGAHAIGQIPIDIKDLDPDFYVSNLHKWLFAHRSVAVFYTKRKHQWNSHSLPISHGYSSIEHPSRFPPSPDGPWVNEFLWIGTQDWSPILSIPAVFEFREKICGGEKRIYDYCNGLAKKGAEEMSKIFGGRIMQNEEGTLIGSMFNVSLPLPYHGDKEVREKQIAFLVDNMFKNQFHLPIYAHNDQWWTRVSVQVYNDLDQLKTAAFSLNQWCAIAAQFNKNVTITQ